MSVAAGSHARRWVQLGVGIALSGLFLYLALRGEDWNAIGRAVADANYFYLLLMVPVGVYALYARSQRWQLLLENASGRRPPILPIFSASAIGFMANMILPFRVGEIARPYLVSRNTGISLSTAFATAVIERVLDLLVLVLFAVGVVAIADVPDLLKRLTWVAAGLAAVTTGGAYAVSAHRTRFVPMLDRIWRRLPLRFGEPLLRLEHEFLDGMSAISDGATFVRALAWSVWVWLVIAAGFMLGFPAAGIDVPLFGGGITVTTVVALAVSVPSAPAFVGQFEWGCKVALEQIFGVPGALAVGYAILLHATQFLMQVLLGLVFVVREGLSFGELGNMVGAAPSLEELDLAGASARTPGDPAGPTPRT